MSDYTPGRYVMAGTDAVGARDGAGLLAQCKYMRDGLASVGHTPALILVVVADSELDDATQKIKTALDG